MSPGDRPLDDFEELLLAVMRKLREHRTLVHDCSYGRITWRRDARTKKLDVSLEPKL